MPPSTSLQVKDAAGTWRDVVLEPNELVLILGHTMRHATAGILSPSTYRVVSRAGAAGVWLANRSMRRLLRKMGGAEKRNLAWLCC